MAIKPVSVSQLNTYVKRILSTDPILCNISVIGEISNLTKHSSGHWYFSLKDSNARVNCFLPSSRIVNLKYDISEGMQITAYGSVSVYEKGGTYSLQIRDIEVEGEGNLKIAFENLKKKLESEGLFDTKYKKEIPTNPKRIGVVTSPTGAAIRDIISTIKRRNSNVDILLYPALVQGDGASTSIVQGIELLNKKFPDLDLIIVGRGGGSAEDLWCFNEENVARAIFASKIPTISAVGHEIDFLISDYVADLRGATPTAAAELAVPLVANLKEKLEYYAPENVFSIIEDRVEKLDYKLSSLKYALNMANPENVLKRGYAILKNESNNYIGSIKDIKENEDITIKLKDGSISAKILGTAND